MELGFAKGHGTRNDFVLVPGDVGPLSAAQVAFLCDRRAGIGGDGLIRVVESELPQVAWFMDYRNADGSLAEMCGNGLRVFARYLVEAGLVSADEFAVETRAGVRQVRLLPDGLIQVSMGQVTSGENPVAVRLGDREYQGYPVFVGNPHAVCPIPVGELAALRLSKPPTWSPLAVFPDGVNVEWVENHGDHRRMRVFERGVGETPSCGTGTVAVAWRAHLETETKEHRILVPGGELFVTFTGDEAWLTGPAEIVARGTVAVPKELS